MSLHLPLRPLAHSKTTFLLHRQPRRTIFDFFKRKERAPALDPLSNDFLQNRKKKLPEPPKQGDLASGSIFDEASPSTTTSDPSAPTPYKAPTPRDPALMALAVDPRPHARRRWERKMVIRQIQQRGRITQATKIARTEREHLAKSSLFYTSVKKLGPLARQISGKSVDDAIVQMRFSKKKAARDVLKHLQLARDEAVVARGMGLGKVNGEGSVEGKEGVIKFVDKKGKRRAVSDTTSMYVDQAWVGRGTYGQEPEYRARGRINMLRPPHTSITVLLKEEKTRIRQAKEREERKLKKKPWVHHPDRPITRQSQYNLW